MIAFSFKNSLRGWFLLVAILAASVATANDPVEMRQLMQLAEYIGVDYSEAVAEGAVINDDEYREMEEFSQLILTRAESLTGTNADRIQQTATDLVAAINDKQSIATVQSKTRELRQLLLTLSPQLSLPAELISSSAIKPLFAENCASCHGDIGNGDGPLASGLNPAPTDFTDRERAMNRSLLGLYDAISDGIEGTAMPGFGQFTDQQRWSLAFYVGGLAFAGTPTDNEDTLSGIALTDWINHNPNTLISQQPGSTVAAIAQLRTQPQALFSEPSNPLALSRARLEAAKDAYHQGSLDLAQKLAVSAYLDGFELVENSLDARDVALRREIETSLLDFRQVIATPGQGPAVDQALAAAFEQLARAEAALTEDSLSSATLFGISFVILLREGLEALLVIIALTTVLLRTQRRDALTYVHLGWITALVAGAATWLAAQTLINISGASREIMEGAAALLAAIVLFWVGFWMHSKTSAAQWQAYIKRSIQHNLKAGTLWGIAGLAFLAVYREVFETVLFYQSLLTQAASTQYGSILGGFFSGAVLLALLAWLMVRYSVRLPIGRFFSVTTYLLLALSFVLMGKAIAALQEAAIIGISPLPVRIEFDWLGIHATWQGVLAQSLIVILSAVLMIRMRGHGKEAEAVS